MPLRLHFVVLLHPIKSTQTKSLVQRFVKKLAVTELGHEQRNIPKNAIISHYQYPIINLWIIKQGGFGLPATLIYKIPSRRATNRYPTTYMLAAYPANRCSTTRARKPINSWCRWALEWWLLSLHLLEESPLAVTHTRGLQPCHRRLISTRSLPNK